MNVLGMNLLTVALIGILALPTGFCREQPDASGAVPASRCCERNDHRSPIPGTAKSSLSCCCQLRLTAVQDTKLRKRAVAELSFLVPPAERRAPARARRPLEHAPIGLQCKPIGKAFSIS